MITLRQLEALQWIVRLGTFERAAQRLNTTQSTISKRIQDLEAAVGLAIFDRSQRGAQLTERGEQVVALGDEMLELHERLLSLRFARTPPARRIRIGVTEMSALTWLPSLVSALREEYPDTSIEPLVASTRELHYHLNEYEVDLIVVPETTYAPNLASVRVAEVVNAWMARPGFVREEEPIPLKALTSYPVLAMDPRSGHGQFYSRWLKSEGVTIPKFIASENLTALLGMTVAGVGVCLLPLSSFTSLIEQGKLVVLKTSPSPPVLPYSAIYRTDRPYLFTAAVADMARRFCNFSNQLFG